MDRPKEVGRRREDDELTEENNFEDLPLDHMDLDEKDFEFNNIETPVPSSSENLSSNSTFFVQMPQTRKTPIKNKRGIPSNAYFELDSNTD